ncbi:MAG: metallophosphoesterase family protein [Candidatus Eremiobacterota bacterium]
MRNSIIIYTLLLIISILYGMTGCGNDGNSITAGPTMTPTVHLILTATPDSLKKGPYLIYPGNNTSMTVMWQTDKVPGDMIIEWGNTTAYGNQAQYSSIQTNDPNDVNLYSYTISNLAPGTKTYYQVYIDGAKYPGSFMTAPGENESSLSFYAYGDTRDNPDYTEKPGPVYNNRVIGQLLKNMNSDNCQTFYLHAGDFVSSGMTESCWNDEYFNRSYSNTMEFLTEFPVLACIGNHEMNGNSGAILFRKYFPYPMYNLNGDPNGFYYSYDYGPLHVSVIDNYNTSYKLNSPQYNWIAQDLAGSKKLWKIVIFHNPDWSAGPEDRSGELETCHSNDGNMHAYDSIFKKNNVRVVISGHNHYYARCEVEGIQYFTLGGGGAGPQHVPEDPNDPNTPSYVIVSKEAYHFARFNISGNIMTYRVIDDEGMQIDPDNGSAGVIKLNP